MRYKELHKFNYKNPKASSTIQYTATGDEKTGMITKIIARLTGKDSERYTRFGRKLLEVKEKAEELKRLQDEVKAETKELVQDLFKAEDIAYTRVVDTVSFVFELSKDPKITETPRYKDILEELIKLQPSLAKTVEQLKKKHVTLTQKSPSLFAVDKQTGASTKPAKGEKLDEGMFDKVRAWARSILDAVQNWASRYDQKLNEIKQMASVATSQNSAAF